MQARHFRSDVRARLVRKLKLEIDADELSIPMTTLGDLFGYVSGVAAHLSNHGAPLAMHQPSTPITDAHGHRVGSWLVVDGPHTTGEEPGNGIANLEAERLARAK